MRSLDSQTHQSGQSGFTLVSVLWLLGVVAVAAAGFAAIVRLDLRTSASFLERSKAELIADGVLNLAAVRLVGGGTMRDCRWDDDYFARILVQDQGGLTDLNAASQMQLQSTFEQVLSPSSAVQLAADVVRERNRANGSIEDIERNAPFEAVEDLAQLPMAGDSYDRIAPLVTVHSSQQGLDPATAPAVLSPVARAFPATSRRAVFAIDVIVDRRGKRMFHRRAIVALLRQPTRPFSILTWDAVRNSPAALESARPVSRCLG